jgi:hypothetical protein
LFLVVASIGTYDTGDHAVQHDRQWWAGNSTDGGRGIPRPGYTARSMPGGHEKPSTTLNPRPTPVHPAPAAPRPDRHGRRHHHPDAPAGTDVLHIDDFSEFAGTGDELRAIACTYTIG